MSKGMTKRRRGLAERLEIRNWCLEQFAACQPYWRIEVELARKFGCHRRTAQRYIAEARSAYEERDQETMGERRELAMLQLDEAYRIAHGKQEARTMIQAVVHRCHLEGLLGPFAETPLSPVPLVNYDPEFEERSEEDLDHYIQHGCWPEEMPKRLTVAAEVTPDDPLAGLGSE